MRDRKNTPWPFRCYIKLFKPNTKAFSIVAILFITIATVSAGISSELSENSADFDAALAVFGNVTPKKVGTGWSDVDFGMSPSEVAEILGKNNFSSKKEYNDDTYKVYALADKTNWLNDAGWFVFKNDRLIYAKKFISYRGDVGPVVAPYLELYNNLDSSLDLNVNSLLKAAGGGSVEKTYASIAHMNFQDADVMLIASSIQNNRQISQQLIISHAEINEFTEQVKMYISKI